MVTNLHPNGFINGFKPDTIYYIAYIDSNKEVKALPVKLEQIYIESSPYSNHKRFFLTKLYLPQYYYKSFMHKWFNKESVKYILDTGPYISTEYLANTSQEAIINLLSITKSPHKGIKNIINKILDTFADNYPDIYLDKIQNYSGMTCSHPPYIKGYSIEVPDNSFRVTSIVK